MAGYGWVQIGGAKKAFHRIKSNTSTEVETWCGVRFSLPDHRLFFGSRPSRPEARCRECKRAQEQG